MGSWQDRPPLSLFEIDFHCHAGTERGADVSLAEYVDFLARSGRKLAGLTDHFGRYRSGRTDFDHYAGSADGFLQFAGEAREIGGEVPDMLILFAPEIGAGTVMDGETCGLLNEARIDYFLGEPGANATGESYGAYLRGVVEWIADSSDRLGVPGFLAHPLRQAVNTIVGKAGREGAALRMPLSAPLPAVGSSVDGLSRLERVLDIDVGSLGALLARYDIPVEINESSWGRVLAMNHATFAEHHLEFYRRLREAGVSFVPGSDMHSVESPAPSPFHIAWLLEVRAADITFTRHWL